MPSVWPTYQRVILVKRRIDMLALRLPTAVEDRLERLAKEKGRAKDTTCAKRWFVASMISNIFTSPKSG
jgi:hypothetical protein